MSYLMSVTLTEESVRARRKTVTRRLGWRHLQPGTRVTLCRKVMGRKRADGTVEPLTRIANVEIVSVRRERLDQITTADIVREGVDPAYFTDRDPVTAQPTPAAWVAWFCSKMRVRPDIEVTRIEWRYLDGLNDNETETTR